MRLPPEWRILAAWAPLAALIVCLPVPVLLRQSILIDDTFYALAAARHLAAGEGSTVDGLHPTNGYQPLWVWILAGVTAAGRLGPDGTVRAALLLCALATGAAGIVAARLVRDLGGSGRAAGWASFLWIVNPYLLKRHFNGLESALAALLLLICVREAVRVQAAGAAGGGPVTSEVRLGLLAGLSALARLDLGVVVPLLALRRRLVAASVAAAVLLPWLLWSWARFGSWVPLSGEATRVWYAAWQGLPAEASLGWEAGNASLALAWLFGLGWPAAALERLGAPRALAGALVPAALAGLLGLAAIGGGLRGRLRSWWASVRPAAPWTVGVALFLWAAYAFAFPAPWHLNRYFLPLHALWAVWLGLFLERAIFHRVGEPEARAAGAPGAGAVAAAGEGAAGGEAAAAGAAAGGAGRARARLGWAVLGTAWLAGLVPYVADTTGGLTPDLQLGVAGWVRERVPAEARVGMAQSGVVGYYAGRPIVNLDGKVNPEAMRALREGTMGDYLIRERIELFGDWSDLVEVVLRRAGPEEARVLCAPLPPGEGPPGPFTFCRVRAGPGAPAGAPVGPAPPATPPPPAASPGPTDPRAW